MCIFAIRLREVNGGLKKIKKKFLQIKKSFLYLQSQNKRNAFLAQLVRASDC